MFIVTLHPLEKSRKQILQTTKNLYNYKKQFKWFNLKLSFSAQKKQP